MTPFPRFVPVIAAMAMCAAAAPATPTAAGASEPVATFSIAGRDSATGDLGVAVQSRFFAVGSVVPWARAGVGAIATQALANTTFGPDGLDLLARGHTPEATLLELLAPDKDRDRRQVGIVDAHGASVNFTGRQCMSWAGGHRGADYTVQGNILVSQATVDSMAAAFEATSGTLGERLMRALEAGQAAGGDSRGMESAAILIVRKGGGYGGWNDRYCDLRVDDSREPIKELRRLFDIWQGQALVLEGYKFVERAEWDRAFADGEAAIRLHPADGEPYYDLACYYSRAGRKADALARLAAALSRDPALAARARADTDFQPLSSDADFMKLVGPAPAGGTPESAGH